MPDTRGDIGCLITFTTAWDSRRKKKDFAFHPSSLSCAERSLETRIQTLKKKIGIKKTVSIWRVNAVESTDDEPSETSPPLRAALISLSEATR